MFVSIVTYGHQLKLFNPMWNQANKTIIQARGQALTVVTKITRKGHWWSYDSSQRYYGPFENRDYCMSDCITYSEYGTTNEHLIKC